MRENSLLQFCGRLAGLCLLIMFVSMNHNPIVRLEAILGLSPSPLERLFGVKGLFSGMTEGMFQLAHGNLREALAANVLTPYFACIVVLCVVFGFRPRITTKSHETLFFIATVVLCIVVNYFN